MPHIEKANLRCDLSSWLHFSVVDESPATHQVGPGGDILGDILQLDSIPGLANLLNDDGFDTEPPTVSRQMNQPMSNQANSAAPGGGGSRFSQFFQQKQLKDKTPSPLLPHLHQQQQPPASDEIAKQFNQVWPLSRTQFVKKDF